MTVEGGSPSMFLVQGLNSDCLAWWHATIEPSHRPPCMSQAVGLVCVCVCTCVFRAAWGCRRLRILVTLMTVRICSLHLGWPIKGTLQIQNLGLNLLATGPLAALWGKVENIDV